MTIEQHIEDLQRRLYENGSKVSAHIVCGELQHLLYLIQAQKFSNETNTNEKAS